MPQAEHHLLEVQDLTVDFATSGGLVHAVQGVSFTLDRGETLAILGESGSGKSVSASAIMSILDCPPALLRQGRILFEGKNLLEMAPEQRRRINGERIAMVFQDTLAHLNPVYPIGWQVAEVFRAHGRASGGEARRRAVQLLDRVGIPNAATRVRDYPHQFSGGQRQRVMIAMALALEPDILIADEPTTALDVTVQAQILELLHRLRAETGMGLLLITHDLGVVADIADRALVMQAGRVVESGPVRQIFKSPADAYTRRLMAAVPGQGALPEPRQPSGPPLLEVVDLTRHYPSAHGLLGRGRAEPVVKALDGVSLELCAGETVGIVGESGSGKTTLTRIALLLDHATSGSVRYRGRDVLELKGADLLAYRRKVQVVFQDPFASLDPRMTVAQIIQEPWAIHKDVLPKSRWAERTAELLRQVGMDPSHMRRWPHQFSGGQRQRIAIARALALEPEIVICDEAVSALDVSIQAQVIRLLKDLQERMGLAYLFIAHDLPVVQDIADRVVVMRQGRIVEQGGTAQIFTSPREPYTRALLAASPVADPDRQAVLRAERRLALAVDG